MTFSQALRTRPAHDGCHCPFVQAIAAGTVPNDVLNYVEQDEHYPERLFASDRLDDYQN